MISKPYNAINKKLKNLNIPVLEKICHNFLLLIILIVLVHRANISYCKERILNRKKSVKVFKKASMQSTTFSRCVAIILFGGAYIDF